MATTYRNPRGNVHLCFHFVRFGLPAADMSILSAELVDRARTLGGKGPLPPWPGVLVDGDVGGLEERIEAAVSCMRGAREAVAAAWNQAPGHGLVGLGRLWALGVAAADGWDLGMVGPRTLTIRRDGKRAVLLPISVPAPRPPDAGLAELRRRLRGVFERRPWSLVVRRPLPDEFDIDRLVEPVRMWLAALERGRWDGDYAIYEDGGASRGFRVFQADPRLGDLDDSDPDATLESLPADLDLSADAEPRPERNGLVMVLPRLDGDLLASDVTERIIAAVQAADAPDNLPLIPVLVRGAPWRMPRRRRLELLYGKLLESHTGPDGATQVAFRRPAGALFGRPELDNVSAVWWLGADGSDALSPRGHADENPWGRFPGEGPRFSGTRLSVLATGPEDDGSPASLSWLNGGIIRR